MLRKAKRLANSAEEKIAIAPTMPVGALKLREARAYLGNLSVPTMHRLIHRGLLRPCRQLRHLIFPISELDRFLREGMSE
jgi:hypothetical protein